MFKVCAPYVVGALISLAAGAFLIVPVFYGYGGGEARVADLGDAGPVGVLALLAATGVFSAGVFASEVSGSLRARLKLGGPRPKAGEVLFCFSAIGGVCAITGWYEHGPKSGSLALWLCAASIPPIAVVPPSWEIAVKRLRRWITWASHERTWTSLMPDRLP